MRSKIIKISVILFLTGILLLGGVFPLLAREGRRYTVRKGDTLWGIGRKYQVETKILAEVNGLDPQKPIFAGQRLNIPSGQGVSYRVKAGDTLWGVARKHKVSLSRLVAANAIKNRSLLRVGQELTIPGPSAQSVWLSDGMRQFLQKISWPLRGVLSSFFGPRDGRMHHGLDIAAEEGKNIKAAMNGEVIFAGPKGTYGNAVILNHGNGVRTLYGHASKVLVSPGDLVPKGRSIAEVGDTGRSTGPHLHFEIQVNGQPVDPMAFLPGEN